MVRLLKQNWEKLNELFLANCVKSLFPHLNLPDFKAFAEDANLFDSYYSTETMDADHMVVKGKEGERPEDVD